VVWRVHQIFIFGGRLEVLNRCLKRGVNALCVALAFATYGQAQEELRIGTAGHSLPFIQVYVAEAQGWLQQDKMRARILPFKAGKDCATALINGELDAAVIGADHAITAPDQQIKQLMVLDRVPGWMLVVSKKYSGIINTPAALRGHNLGVSAPGSATDILLNYLLARQGVSRGEFNPVRAGIETFSDVMRQGGIDAGMVVEPHGTQLVQSGEAFILVDFRSPDEVQKYVGSFYTGTCLLVRRDVIERKRQSVQQLTNALVWACKWLQTASAEEVQALLPREYTPEPELWKKAFAGYKNVFSPDGRNDVAGLNAVIAAQVEFGGLRSPVQHQAELLIDDSFWTVANQIPIPPPANIRTPKRQGWAESRVVGKVLFGLVLLLILFAMLFTVRRPGVPKVR
jgi:NitT/TauT family transport system substrate-binding protein